MILKSSLLRQFDKNAEKWAYVLQADLYNNRRTSERRAELAQAFPSEKEETRSVTTARSGGRAAAVF